MCMYINTCAGAHCYKGGKKMREEVYEKVLKVLSAPYWGKWRWMRDIEVKKAVKLLDAPWVRCTSNGVEIRRLGYTEVVAYEE